ncbi:cation:proton antiporter [Proteiniclasticum sp.]|uniref:cation:proton antiporter n=1 Tax=Proteiniclasticum sp. TaxID=2053595 RepID=UPI002898BD67|nr:cation:proton antiporter [Proteiniclasticum sp.]
MTLELIGRLTAGVVLAFFMGKLVSRMKLPAILGWLLAGMILGPHAFGLLNSSLLSSSWYRTLLSILECAMGLLIGTELVMKELKKSGKQIVTTTIVQSLWTFLTVTVTFGVIFHFTGTTLLLAPVFGSIALATAPAPALSIVKEFRTQGPVTKTLIPLAALDDIVAIIVFFTLITLLSATGKGGMSLPLTLFLMIVLPIVIGCLIGLLGSKVLKIETSRWMTLLTMILLILAVASVGLYINRELLPKPMMNFMLMGLAFSATFANLVPEKRLKDIMEAFSPVLGISLLTVILNLGAPLDYHLILGAGMFTAVYILSRALGKYSGAYAGGKLSGLPATVKKYLGLTLLPHSGVSLVFTAIAVSTLKGIYPDSAVLLQGTIAAAAIINEVIAVIVAKQAFEWAGEIQKEELSGIDVSLIS